MKRMLVVVALTIVTSRELVAQLPKPVIEQPTPVTGVSSGTHGPKMPTMPRKTDPASRAAGQPGSRAAGQPGSPQ